MKLFKLCLVCSKPLFKKYDELKYPTVDANGVRQVGTAYLCKKHGKELDDKTETL
jgi:hypothetical protein